jgi:hypothetical protein
MDFITVDVTDVPPSRRGAWVKVMGDRVTVDDLTDQAGTIGYERSPPRPARLSRLRASDPNQGQATRTLSCQNFAGRWRRAGRKCAACGEWNTIVGSRQHAHAGLGPAVPKDASWCSKS